MALRFLDSFDHYTTVAQKYPVIGAGTIGAAALRTGAAGIRDIGALGFGAELLTALDAQATWIMGCGNRRNAYGDSFGLMATNNSGDATYQAYFVPIATTRIIKLQLISDVVAESSATLTVNTYEFCELKHVIHGSAGTIEGRINGVVVATFSGDTQGTSATADRVAFGGSNDTDDHDDHYVCDGTGTVNNSYLAGPTSPYFSVETLLPSGAGTTTEWTPSASTNVSNVDEAAPDSDTTYNHTATTDAIDLYAMGNLAGTVVTIAGIQYLAFTRDELAGDTALKRLVRVAGTNYAGSAYDPGTSYAYNREILETSPATSLAWTQVEADAMEAGVQYTGVGVLIARVSQVVIEVGYNADVVAGPGGGGGTGTPATSVSPLRHPWIRFPRRLVAWGHHKEAA